LEREKSKRRVNQGLKECTNDGVNPLRVGVTIEKNNEGKKKKSPLLRGSAVDSIEIKKGIPRKYGTAGRLERRR